MSVIVVGLLVVVVGSSVVVVESSVVVVGSLVVVVGVMVGLCSSQQQSCEQQPTSFAHFKRQYRPTFWSVERGPEGFEKQFLRFPNIGNLHLFVSVVVSGVVAVALVVSVTV